MRKLIKVCCISSVKEAETAVKYGASLLGLVSEMPSGPGVIEESLIREIADFAPPGVTSVLLTSKTDSTSLIEQQRRCRVNALQLVDRVDPHVHLELKTVLPGIKIIQVIHVGGEESIDEAKHAAKTADALLLDSGDQTKKVKELGGTGRIHNWKISERICRNVEVPVFLAGGLNPANAVEALEKVNPAGLDICSGLRTEGDLDEEKTALFFSNIRKYLNQ